MRRWAIVITGVLLALAAFYGAWPAYTGYVIRTAIKGGDAASLAAKVDFAAVRANLRPVVVTEVQRMIEERRENGNALTRSIARRMNGGLTRRLTLTVVDRVATPENTIRLAHYGGTLRQFLRRAVTDELARPGATEAGTGGAGGSAIEKEARELRRGVLDRILGRSGKRDKGGAVAAEPAKTAEPQAPSQPAPEPAAVPEAPPVPRKLTLANVKRLALTGPLTLEVGINRDASQHWAEITAVLQFTGLDWRVVALVPSLER